MSAEPPLSGSPFAGDGVPDGPANDESPPIEFQPLDPLTEATFAELQRPAAGRTWLQSVFLLLVSIVIFAMTGLFENKPLDLVILIGVLLFHELGHYAGMRWFNYQDVRMFFI